MAPVTCDRPRVHRRVLLVAVLGSLLRGLSFTFWSSALEGTRAGPASAIARRASKEESQVLKLCDEYPLNDADIDDQEEMMTAVKKLPEAPDDCYQLFLGDWKVEWSSMGGQGGQEETGPQWATTEIEFCLLHGVATCGCGVHRFIQPRQRRW
ncbi:unnamed protein product [Durusdinium trenchii]|uniref:Plastid lipid-associated protein/fibrillin conserved domain-containing protein n=1 Tax=Durusdinium trenchii TaxID=1381693 RepID=A0ABP0PB99_9DINO